MTHPPTAKHCVERVSGPPAARPMGRLGACVVVLLAAAGAVSPAAAWQGSKTYRACIDAAGGVDPAMGDCARQEFVAQDKLLNSAYAARLAAAEGTLREAVRAAQRAWLAYRDTTCEAEGAAYEGGTMQPLAVAECRIRLTIERADWLRTLVP